MTLIDHRYQLQTPLGSGGMGSVYRALDRLNGQTIALKRVTVPDFHLEFMTRHSDTVDVRLSLAQEFKTLASLRHPHIINVLDYGFGTFDQTQAHQPYFTMDLLENAQTILEAARTKSTTEKVTFLTQTLQALAYLHRRSIIHRDLKPDNVLVVNDAVKVLDFGLAIAQDQLRQKDSGDKQVAGTLAYLAPEVLQGKPATIAADLYSVGIIAYELFAGQYPFDTRDITQLIFAIVSVNPTLDRVGENVALQRVIARMIAKNPDERYADAESVISALNEAVDRPIPQESTAIRESFLQAAQFVGRESELTRLEQSLTQIVENSSGSAWLVGGESGVGKSRLLDELRIRAMVRGALVLRGQCVQDGGGLSYQLWREPLRRLVLSTELSDLEASVLKEVVPDITDLIGRPVADAPALDGSAGQQRLLLTIADVFRRQKRPILLLLEDLQWAVESLEVLTQHLNRSLPELALLVVGNYRDDERPDLPEKLPGTLHIKLSRFDNTAVARLSESMLGTTGARPEVIDLLQRETEGNVFFLVEVVRALAEDAGSLSEVGSITLPDSVFVGGMMQIVQRRLDRVPMRHQNLLKMAAVIGRQIDLKLLRHLMPGEQIDEFLMVCLNAAVLETHNGVWNFAHDKLREGALQGLADSERPTLHRKAAEGLEALYPNDPSRASLLAYHWQMVGDHAKERHYRVLAGKQAVEMAYYREALTAFERAITLLEIDAHLERASLQCDIAQCLIFLSEYPPAELLLEQALVVIREKEFRPLLAKALHRQGDIADFRGDFVTAEKFHAQSVELYRTLGDQELLADGLRSLGTSQYQQGKIEPALECFGESKAIYETLKHQLKIAQSSNNIANVIGSQGDYTAARSHLEAALETLRVYGDRKGIANCLNNLGVMALNQDDFESALRYYQEAVKLSQEIGNRQSAIIGFYNLGETAELLHDLPAAEHYYRQGLSEAVGLNSLSLITAFMTGIARLFMHKGQGIFAAELFGLLMHHPSMINEVKEQLKTTLDELREQIGESLYTAAYQRGAALELDEMVKRITHDKTHD